MTFCKNSTAFFTFRRMSTFSCSRSISNSWSTSQGMRKTACPTPSTGTSMYLLTISRCVKRTVVSTTMYSGCCKSNQATQLFNNCLIEQSQTCEEKYHHFYYVPLHQAFPEQKFQSLFGQGKKQSDRLHADSGT